MKKAVMLFIILLLSVEFIYSKNILIVQDGSSQDVCSYYKERIRNMEIVTLNTQKDNIDFATIRDYDAILWICGDSHSTLSNNEKILLDKYLKIGNKGLYLEGENIINDSAFIDNGFFYKRNFNIKYLNYDNGKVEVATHWSNPITWGMKEKFFINTISKIDVMGFEGFNERDIIMKIEEKNNHNKEVKCLGVGIDRYNYRAALLSFSPALRNVREIDTSSMINNLADWLTLSGRDIIEKIISRNDVKDSYSELLMRRIINAFDLGIYTEFDFMQQKYKEGVFPEFLYKYIFENLKGKYQEQSDWQNNDEIKLRVGVVN
ncbi:MAG: hypothetical protein M0R46_03650 [Candidatus Muirbacterium halophilum]|nr:hypothetical protein [Candidatus Muirbacterium halophilum]MCK9474985.1 hypothetical protein [Candidatus Muirbacterium halophilum]